MLARYGISRAPHEPDRRASIRKRLDPARAAYAPLRDVVQELVRAQVSTTSTDGLPVLLEVEALWAREHPLQRAGERCAAHQERSDDRPERPCEQSLDEEGTVKGWFEPAIEEHHPIECERFRATCEQLLRDAHAVIMGDHDCSADACMGCDREGQLGLMVVAVAEGGLGVPEAREVERDVLPARLQRRDDHVEVVARRGEPVQKEQRRAGACDAHEHFVAAQTHA